MQLPHRRLPLVASLLVGISLFVPTVAFAQEEPAPTPEQPPPPPAPLPPAPQPPAPPQPEEPDDEPEEPEQPPATPPVQPTPPSTPPSTPPDTTPPVKEHPLDVRVTSQVGAYGDTDHVFVFSPAISANIADVVAGWNINARYLVDVVSAASVDIVSTASRRWEEVRNVGTLGGAYKFGEWTAGANADVSIEPDYQAYTFSGNIQRDLLQKRATALLGYEYAHDIAGRGDTPFSVFSRKIDHHALKGGLTYIIDKSTLVSGVADVLFENGDTSKPYRYVAMFAPGVAVPNGASVDLVNQIRLPTRVLEQLPTHRNRYALTGHLAHRFETWTARAEERFYTDSWGLRASTTDLRAIFDIGDRVDLGPHLRFHGQTEVAFWSRAYTIEPGNNFPALRTGDRQLGPLMGFTGGGTFHYGLGNHLNPRSWLLGVDANVTETKFLDDLFITDRLSVVSTVSLEASF